MTANVLLVDDHALLRRGLRTLLEEEEGLSVVGEAGDGREALQKIGELSPDVVVMDIAMPELNGTEATRQIRETCPSTQVVILSMHASSENIFQALKAGAQGYVFKESAGKEVVDAVRKVRAGRRYISQRIAEQVVDDYMLQRESVPGRSPLDRLSPREREILQLVAEGKSSAAIAGILHLSPKTVDTYRSRLMQKLNISDISGLVRFAIQQGLIPLE